MRRVVGWTREQDAFLAAHGSWENGELAEALSGLGPPRTAVAVATRRKVLGVRRPRRAHVKPAGSIGAQVVRSPDRARREGWPVMRGSPEERDRRFARAVLNAQLAAIQKHGAVSS